MFFYDWYLNFSFYSKLIFNFIFILFSKMLNFKFLLFQKTTILGTFSKTFYGRYLRFEGGPGHV